MKKFICGLLVGIMLALGVTTYAVPEIKQAAFSDIKLVVNGKQVDSEVVSVVTTDKPGYMTNYVPARALAESLGATVTWDGKERVISVNTEAKEVSATPAQTQAPAVEAKPNPDVPYPVYLVDDTGLIVYNIHGNRFYGILASDVIKAVESKGYIMNYSNDRTTMQIVKEGEGVLLRDITFKPYGGKGYLSYDFFTEHIKPLLQN